MSNTWADEMLQELMTKGRNNWSVEDWEAYCYIECCNAESNYYNQLD